jgi:hypothetical protein
MVLCADMQVIILTTMARGIWEVLKKEGVFSKFSEIFFIVFHRL